MEYQNYLAKVEKHFQKGEYISIAQLGAKMLWQPISSRTRGKLFCFVLNGIAANGDLVKKLAKYAQSITFYESNKQNEKIDVITLFVYKNLSDRKASFFEKGIKMGAVNVLPAAFDLEKNELTVPSKFPLLSSRDFENISAFCKKALTKNTEE